MDTVLLVDADPIHRNFITHSLTSAGYSVLEAATPAETAQIVRTEREIHVAVIASVELMDTATDIAQVRTSLPIIIASTGLDRQRASQALPRTATLIPLGRPLVPVILLEQVRRLLTDS
jgi:CheY-like chemotaxis protein